MENIKSASQGVTVIGLGVMGATLAKALLAGNIAVTVWNRSIEKAQALEAAGAAIAGSLEEAIAVNDLILICVSTYDDVYKLLEPLKKKLSGKILLNISSGTSPDDEVMDVWAKSGNIEYLSGAAMSGTILVGQEEALFIYSGSKNAFDAFYPALKSFGQAVYLGGKAGDASNYDSSLYSVIWGAVAGFFNGAALLQGNGVKPTAFASVAIKHLPFIAYLMEKYAQQAEQGIYPPDEGSLLVHSGAMDHVKTAGSVVNMSSAFPDYIKSVIDKGIAMGHKDDGLASVYDAFLKKD